MVRRARKDTALVIKERPTTLLLWLLVPVTPAVVVSLFVQTDEWALGWRIALGLLAGGTAGTLIILASIFVAKLVSARRHQLEDRVGDLEEEIRDQGEQLLYLTQEKYGARDAFVPIYYDMRTALRDAHAKIDVSIQTGVLWDRSAGFECSPWDKNRRELGDHRWPREDGIYGPCSEAFQHLSRLNTAGVFRFGERAVKPSDNLQAALDAIKAADEALTAAIGEAKPDQP